MATKDPVEQKNNNSGFIKTDGGKTKSNAIEIPSISLPKGGGAIKGIDEKFMVNAVNGTSSFSIPLPVSSARGAGPTLSLSYNSGSGNGIFGLGWSMGLASIKRKTDKGLPQYLDAIDSDTFLFSDAEDLVSEFVKNPDGSFPLDANGDYIIHEKNAPGGLFTIRFYKPRTEGLFARIERWSSKAPGEIKWRVTTKDNITTLFGWSPESRISDPHHPGRTYEWLPEFVYDDKGNCSRYIYKKEDDKGLDLKLLHNRNRVTGGSINYTNLYLSKILYGNKTVFKKLHDPFPAEPDFLFSTVFDYGDFDPNPPFSQTPDWDFRKDAFSDYKAGFEIRTTRRCKRVLLFHHFKGPNEYDGLVKSLDIDYFPPSDENISLLRSVTTKGYIRTSATQYEQKSMPPSEFIYQQHEWDSAIKTIAPSNIVNAPSGIDDQQYHLTDLYSEGLPGILTEQANGLYYKHNIGNGNFLPAKLISPKPSLTGFGSDVQLMDIESDGSKQLVSLNTEVKGYFDLDDDDEWHRLKTFDHFPNVNFKDPNTRMIDLNGDGKPEIVIINDNVLKWFPSLGKKGFEPAREKQFPFDNEQGPSILFANDSESWFLADMTGDGLTDFVRIKNGEAAYWPNKGFGNFGYKISMDNPPVFDHADSFNPSYLRLADIDGTGTADIIYIGNNRFTCWMNQCGNSFPKQPVTMNFPAVHNRSRVTIADLLGTGLSCIICSDDLPANANTPLRYIDLMAGKKPYVMITYKNNLGKEVHLSYTPSTTFYLADKQAGTPWVTKLHFPVHCLSAVETLDKVSGSRFITTYKYHHGYYDHTEREFRGFGMVEQIDSEHYENWIKGSSSNVVDRELHQDPVISRTWFHTGAFFRRSTIANHFASGYWYEEMKKKGFPVVHNEIPLTDASIIPAPGIDQSYIDNLSAQEWQQAFRSCKGTPIRTELFVDDAQTNGNTTAAQETALRPYSVSTNSSGIELIQPKGKNKYAVYLLKESQSIDYIYERDTTDPRISHNLAILLDEYGNILESASVVYPRLKVDNTLPGEIQQQQDKTIITYSTTSFTNDVIDQDNWRLRLPSEIKTYELKGVKKTTAFYSHSDFKDILNDTKSAKAEYHEYDKPHPAAKALRRLIENTRTLYYANNLSSALPLHQLDSLALTFENYQLAYDAPLLQDIFQNRINNTLLNLGKFTQIPGNPNWWVRSGTIQYKKNTESIAQAQNRFYSPISYTDPYGAITSVQYYSNYFLFIEQTIDALNNRFIVEKFNFRTLSPRRMKDINGNLSEAFSDELGMVKAMAVMGKGNQADDLAGLTEQLSLTEINQITTFFNAPDSIQLTAAANTLLQHASARFVYDLFAWKNNGKPVSTAIIERQEHFQKNNNSPLQLTFEYSNGLGQTIMKKIQAEPGLAKKLNLNPVDDTYTVTTIDTNSLNPKQLRWVGNGRDILNNKGNAVKQYQPYFSVTHQFEDAKELVETGVTSVLHYDALNRLVKTVNPDNTISRTEFNSWNQKIYDPNDNVLVSPWYINRTSQLINATLAAEGKDPLMEKAAADKTALHANTPTILHFDTLGRSILSVDHNRDPLTNADVFSETIIRMDIEGNLRSVLDPRNNETVSYKYDMLGNLVYQDSRDTGKRWLFMNILAKPLRTWDERNHEFQYFYDLLHRPTHNKIIGGDGTPLDHIYERIFYGETLLTPNRSNEAAIAARNLLGQRFQHFDTGGMIEMPEYDFKGQSVSTTRKLFKKYKETANWIDANLVNDLEPQPHTFLAETDAQGRITKQTTPDGTVVLPSYNEAGLLKTEQVIQPGQPSVTYIKLVSYNEKGEREKIIYGNDVTAKFYYDRETFRLIRIESFRQNGNFLQDWCYTYDPVGNITHIEDKNIPVKFFNTQKIKGVSEYTYDCLYQLSEAKGRENDAALAFGTCDNWNDKPFLHALTSGSNIVLRNYTQKYTYDKAGNITEMKHTAPGGSWTRSYQYEAANNRIKSTSIGNHANPGNYTKYKHHSKHGYLEELPHLEKIAWNFKEEVVLTSRQHCTADNIPVITYYQYDGEGKRIRKLTENPAAGGGNPTKKEERIYLGDFEIYKMHTGAFPGLERTTFHLVYDELRYLMIETRNNINDGTDQQLVRYQMQNHHGSSALELDQNAAVISYEEFHPFGTTAYQATNKSIKSAAKRYRFTGMERDDETGLEYHSARYYLPWLGRWLSADPIGIEDGLNLYQYSKNNPVLLVDPSGTECDPDKKCCLDSGEDYASEDVIFHPNDVVYHITEIQKPGDVDTWWGQGPKANKEDWAHPLSEMEQGYIKAMRDKSVPAAIQMRAPVDPKNMTAAEKKEAEKFFGNTPSDYEKYANFENRRRIVAHYFYTHPATVALLMGWYRLFRDVNPIHFAFERGWQIGSGKEMFTQEKVSRLGAAAEFFLALALSYGISKGLRSLRYAPKGPVGAKGTITDDANFAQRTYKNAFTNEPGAGFKGLTVDQVSDALKAGVMHPRMVPVDYIIRDGKMLILNTRSAQALTQAGIPRSQWIGVNRTGNPAFEGRLTGQLKRNKLTTSGTPTVKRTGPK